MREEVEKVVKSDGWTKLAMQKMRKVDSFMKESQRYNGLGARKLSPDLINYQFLMKHFPFFILDE